MTGPTELCWLCGTLAVTLARVDFLDPATDAAQARERGVRLEIRPLETDGAGSIYASPALALAPAVCRIDLLESEPGAADRMHWHPVMAAGEPGARTYDPSMPADPAGWLSDRLHEVESLLERSGMQDVGRHRPAAFAIAAASEEIVDAARAGLVWARAPWPGVERDERGMAAQRRGPGGA